MNHLPPSRELREHPDLEQLKRQAKELLHAYRDGQPEAISEVNTRFRNADAANFALHDAHLVLARSYGFDSWPKLKAYVDGATVRRLVDAVRDGDLERVKAMLRVRPELANMELAENNEHRAIHYAVFARSAEMVRLLMAHGADARAGIYPHRAATSPYTIAKERGYNEIIAIIEQAEAQRRGTDTPAPDELTELIADGQEEEALSRLQGSPELAAARNRNGWSLLHAASNLGSESLAAWLLDHGADVNARGPDGRTPLDCAGSESIATLLRARGAEMTARGAVRLGDADWLKTRHDADTLDSQELLTVAVKSDRLAVLQLLLSWGLDPNERTRLPGLEETIVSAGAPLWHCADTGKLEMAELLLQHGADPNVHVYAAGPSVHKAYEHKNQAMIDLLAKYGGVLPPVSIGLFRERALAAQMLADEAAGHRLPDGILEGRNVSEDLLRGAADSGDPEIVRMALPGVDWPRDDGRWFYIFMQAIWSGNTECVALLLSRCDPNIRHPRFGRTILHDVAGLGLGNRPEQSAILAGMLIDAGARLDARDDVLLSTPLGWACRWGRIAMVEVLLERGADPVESEAEPWATPLAWAQTMGHEEIAGLLKREC